MMPNFSHCPVWGSPLSLSPSNKGLTSRIHNILIQLNNKTQITQFLNGQWTWIDIFPKKIQKWPISTWRDTQVFCLELLPSSTQQLLLSVYCIPGIRQHTWTQNCVKVCVLSHPSPLPFNMANSILYRMEFRSFPRLDFPSFALGERIKL